MIHKFLSLLMVILMGMSMTSCSDNSKNVGGEEVETNYEKDTPIDFDKISLRINGTMAEATVFEVYNTDKGVRFEHYSALNPEEEKNRWYFCEFDGTDEDYRFFTELFGKAGIKDWDGFSGSDPDALDGESFVFDATLAGGSAIYANGSNSFPEGYGILKNGLYEFSDNHADAYDE